MDPLFFSERLLVIARHRHNNFLFARERLYYRRYMGKIRYGIVHLESNDIAEALEYVEDFKYKQQQRIENDFFIKPRRMLGIVCEDAKDVLEGMRRWDGVGAENWDFWVNERKVNFWKGNCFV